MNTTETAHKLAAMLGINVTDPDAVVEARARAAALAVLQDEPRPTLNLADLPEPKWEAAIKKYSGDLARYTALSTQSQNEFRRAVTRAEIGCADHWLAQLHAPAMKAVEEARAAADKITTLDPAQSIERLEAEHLRVFQVGVSVAGGYGTLLSTLSRGRKSAHDGGLTVPVAATVINPGDVPEELIMRDNMARPVINPDDEKQHIDQARKVLRTGAAGIPDLIQEVLMGQHAYLAIALPATVAEMHERLAAFDEANKRAWAEDRGIFAR